ncbi:hypothetical protein [Mumia zhuanghuii]|uniref:hypothetical protein n=1 Tax=Mumia zhuanghuii TaxID=2585211 RepID=UPI0036317BB3
MPRPASTSLTRERPSWRPVPMPGANGPIDAVALAGASAPFALRGRFPAGFARTAEGGYAAAEEFVVLSGGLVLDGIEIGAGSLVHVGARRLRRELVAPRACEVLVWFGGAPDFVHAERFDADPDAGLDIWTLAEALPVRTPVAQWSAGSVSRWPAGSDGFDRRWWSSSREQWPGGSADEVVWRTAVAPEGSVLS